MYIRSLEGARDFFVHFFETTAFGMYHNVKMDFRSYFLSIANGSRLEIMGLFWLNR